MNKYWTPEFIQAVANAESFETLAEIAIKMLDQMSQEGKPIVEICGPISTGGEGDLLKNIKKFELAIKRALENNLLVFNVGPFESAIQKLKKKYPITDGYCLAILDTFYLTIFKSGYIKQALFLADWQSSKGACWERETLSKLNIPIADYPIHWLK